ncbi:hypothetical protein [Streptomyces atacamensis]|uniref:hypothetical protein n=1 Tax=Streptomyces atacamensis TaxID=531966 RepID=UPI00399CE472
MTAPRNASPVRLLVASTPHGAALLAAAADAGLLGTARERLLLVANTAPVPETVPAPDALPGFRPLRDRFGRVLSWNAAVAPLHPGAWTPRPDDAPLWERQLRSLWGLGDAAVELVVEGVEAGPGQALARIFPDAPLDVYATGLSAYGPTPGRLDPLVGTRVRRLLHPGLVPGLRPLLLAEFGVPAEEVPGRALRAVAARAARELPDPGAPEGAAVLLGQDPHALGALPPGEEERVYGRLLGGLREAGHRAVVLAPHPAAPAHRVRGIARRAAELGLELYEPQGAQPVEALYERLRPALVTGRSFGALLAASRLHGLPASHGGTAVPPAGAAAYEGGGPVAAVIADALLPDGAGGGGAPGGPEPADTAGTAELAGLVRAVAFCAQPRVNPGLRGETELFLAAHPEEHVRRWFPRRLLASLALPGGLPTGLGPVVRNPAVRRAARRARALGRRARR